MVSVLYGTQAKRKLRPYLLSVQVSLIVILISTIIGNVTDGNLLPTDFLKSLFGQTFGHFLGYMIISWLIIQICFIIRFRNDQSNIFTRNRRT